MADAKKQLGKDGKLTEPRVDPMAAMDEVGKAMDALGAQRTAMEKQIVAAENALDAAKNAVKQYAHVVAADDFGLNEKDAKDKKTIDAVKKLVVGKASFVVEQTDLWKKVLDSLDKAVSDLNSLNK